MTKKKWTAEERAKRLADGFRFAPKGAGGQASGRCEKHGPWDRVCVPCLLVDEFRAAEAEAWDRALGGLEWGVFITDSTEPNKPIAAFVYADEARAWGFKNYGRRAEIRTLISAPKEPG